MSEPRSRKGQESGGITHADCRWLADQVHVRAAIETVKNAQTKKEWTFTLRPNTGERIADAMRRAETDPRIKEVADFFLEPDGEHDFAEWTRMLFEDLLVIDAPALYNHQRRNGLPFRLEVFDGATITPLLDEAGRSPRGVDPRTGREREAYQQWLYGQPGHKFSRAEMMYAPRNPRPGKAFGRSPVEQLAFYISIAYRKDIQRLATYTDGNVPAGLLPMPSDWKSAQIEAWWNSFTVFVKGLPQNQVKLVPIPGGTGTPIFPSLEANKDQWEESWIRLVCFAFDISVAALVREMTKATAETNRDAAEQDGAAAYTDWWRRRLNWIVRNWFGYSDIVAVPKQELDVEAKTQAEIDDLKLAKGVVQVNEVRARDGVAPIKALEGREGYFGPSGWVAFDAAIASADLENLETATDTVDGAGASAGAPAPLQSQQQNEGLRVGDITAAQAIVKDVAAGTIPRDAGVGQLRVFFKFTDADIAAIMGSAGNPNVPTTPNPQPAVPPSPAPVTATAEKVASRLPAQHETAKAAPPFDYASTQVNLEGDVAEKVLEFGATLVPDEALAEKGRETDPHVTIKYGLDPSTTFEEVFEVIENSDTIKEIAARGAVMRLGATAIFEAEEYDVVIIGVDSPDLVKLNEVIAEALPVTDTHPEYVPHVTLAYVKKGEGAKYAGEETLAGTAIRFDTISFSDTDGDMVDIPLAGEGLAAYRDEEKAALRRVKLRKSKLVEAHRRPLAKAIAKFLARERARIAEEAVARFEELTKAEGVGEISIDWSELGKTVAGPLEKVYSGGARSAAKDLGVEPFNKLNEAAKKYARERGAELVGKKWVETEGGFALIDNPNPRVAITETTREHLNALIERAVDDGWQPDELRRAILDSGEFSEARAQLIADTELATAQSYGSIREWNESGAVKKKGWLLSGNHAVDDDCDENAAAGEIAMDEKFPSGAMTSPAHPGCDCDVYAVVE